MTLQKLLDEALQLAKLSEQPQDTGILHEGKEVKRVLMGIDMETPELILAKELGFDAVVSHHPHGGSPTVDFSKVMNVQIDKMVEFGVPINRAQKALKKKQLSVDIGSHVSNYDRVGSAAKLLDMPYMNIHLPADLISERTIQTHLDEQFGNSPKTKLGDIIRSLKALPYYEDVLAGPVIRVGSENDFAGKIAVLFAGGTNGGADVYKAYFDCGVGTIVAMHMPEDVKKAVEEQGYGNVIVAGHMASDSIGLNVIIEHWRSLGVEVVKMAGILK